MQTQWNAIIIQASGAQVAERGEVIQTLWSGYGEIVRYGLRGADIESLVVKHVHFLVGWMPTHWKINDYNKRITLDVLATL